VSGGCSRRNRNCLVVESPRCARLPGLAALLDRSALCGACVVRVRRAHLALSVRQERCLCCRQKLDHWSVSRTRADGSSAEITWKERRRTAFCRRGVDRGICAIRLSPWAVRCRCSDSAARVVLALFCPVERSPWPGHAGDGNRETGCSVGPTATEPEPRANRTKPAGFTPTDTHTRS